MKFITVITLVIAASMTALAQEEGGSELSSTRWRTGAVVYHTPDACYVASNFQAAAGGAASPKLYPAQLLLPHEVVQLNKELGTSCKDGASWWLTTTPPQLPSLADYLLQYAVNKTKFSGTGGREVTRVRRSSASATTPSDRLRRRLHELTQRLAPGADWTTTGVVQRRGRVQLTDDPYPSPLFSRQPNGKRFKHYKAFYDEIARQANSNARPSDTARESTSPQRNSIQRYSLRIRNQPSNARLKSGDGQPLQRRIARNRLRSRQYPSTNEERSQLSTNDKRNANSENYEFVETGQHHDSNSDIHENNFASAPQNLIVGRNHDTEDDEFVNQRSTETYDDANNSEENSLIFSQSHGSAGPHGSFQAESQGSGPAGEETRSAVDGGQHGASASSSAIRFDQQALAHVQVSPQSSGQSQLHEHPEESENGAPTAVSASEIEDMMRRNGFTGFAMATVSSRKKERGRNKVKPLTSFGLSVPGNADEPDTDALRNDLNNDIGDEDYHDNVGHHENDVAIIDHGGLVGGTGDYHRESEFQQINQAEIPEGGLDGSQNGGSVGLATYTQGASGYPPENDYSDDYYDFERYNHNPPLYFPDEYGSFDDSLNIADSHFHDTDGSSYYPSEYQPENEPGPSDENISEGLRSYPYEQNGATAVDENHNNFRYEEGIPYGQDIISYHKTGGLYDPNQISSGATHINENSFDGSLVDDGSGSIPYNQGSDSSFDQSRTNDQINQIEYNVRNREPSPQVTNENRDFASGNSIPNNGNGGQGMMIVDDSLQSYFFQPPDIEVSSGRQPERYPNPDHVFDYDVHSRTTDLSTPYNSYDQAGILGGFPVIEHVAQAIPVSTDAPLETARVDSSVASTHLGLAEGSFWPPVSEDDIHDQNGQEIFSEDQSKMQQIGAPIQSSTQEISYDRELNNVPLYYPPGYNDRQPASQGIDNTFTSYSSHYGSPVTPGEEIYPDAQNIPYDNRYDSDVAAPTEDDEGLDDYTFINESEGLDSNYEPDDYTIGIPAAYNTSHSVYSTTHHYGYQRGSNERGIGSTSNTVLLPAVVPSMQPSISVSESASTVPFPQTSHLPSTSPDSEQSHSSSSQDRAVMRVLTPGNVGSTQSLPAADPNLANVQVVMAEAPRNGGMSQRTGKILISGEKIPGTTGYLIPPGFRGRLILGNLGVSSSSQAQMMPDTNSQNLHSMQGMQMRVSSSSSATSTGSGVSLSSSSSSDASPRGLLLSSSSSASSPQRQQTNYNGYNQPVYSYQRTFNSQGNGGTANGGRPSNQQMNWQPSAQNNPGMRSKSWSSWRTSSSWSNDNAQSGSPGSGQYFSQSALQPTSRDCGYWSMRCNMVYGPFKQNEICHPTHVILPCCC